MISSSVRPAPSTCPLTEGHCYSFSNDASLLLPTSALRGEYFVIAEATHHLGVSLFSGGYQWRDKPGFVSITATQSSTVVKVRSSAYVRSGKGVQKLSPEEETSFTLSQGDVLQLVSDAPPPVNSPAPDKPCGTVSDGVNLWTLCPSGADYDLTGTHIDADKPVSVIAGHDCTFMPYSRWACDHVEESQMPVESLGTELHVTAPQAVASIDTSTSTADPMVVRILSASDDNEIEFDPPSVHAPVTLAAGAWLEIGPTEVDFLVKGTGKLMVAEYLLGEHGDFSPEPNPKRVGDPSVSLAIPKEQFRKDYTFLAPETYSYNFVNVIAPSGVSVSIDGMPISADEFQPIGQSGDAIARHQLPGGTHTIESNEPVGVVSYGYGRYTSYMYPAGLDLATITVPVK